jgi:hypothetical protein
MIKGLSATPPKGARLWRGSSPIACPSPHIQQRTSLEGQGESLPLERTSWQKQNFTKPVPQQTRVLLIHVLFSGPLCTPSSTIEQLRLLRTQKGLEQRDPKTFSATMIHLEKVDPWLHDPVYPVPQHAWVLMHHGSQPFQVHSAR